jgi:hypothetical protein
MPPEEMNGIGTIPELKGSCIIFLPIKDSLEDED